MPLESRESIGIGKHGGERTLCKGGSGPTECGIVDRLTPDLGFEMQPQPYPKLTHPPIVEAVIEFKVATAAKPEMSDLDPLREALKERFPKVRKVHIVQTQLRVEEDREPQQQSTASPIGLRFDSTDERFVVQPRLDGIAVSQLAPYDEWDQLLALTKDMWAPYATALKVSAVTRLGVRYINRIELSDPVTDLDRVLTAGPKIPPAMPQGLMEFFSRVVVPVPALRAHVAIMQTLDPGPPPQPGKPSSQGIILDIDAFSEETFSPDDPALWTALAALRNAKNMAFFGSITPDTLKAYQ